MSAATKAMEAEITRQALNAEQTWLDATLSVAEKAIKLAQIETDLAGTIASREKLVAIAKAAAFLEVGWSTDDKTPPAATVGTPVALKSFGEQFVESDAYKALIGGVMKGSSWQSQTVELKTILTEGTTGTPGGGNPFIAIPTVIPGVVDIKLAPLTVADLMPNSTTGTPLIRYLMETILTNAATTVAEGGLKPESAIAFAKVDEVLHKIATLLPITDEMLEDWQQAMSYVNTRLSLFIAIAEELQLLSGDGTGENLTGLLNRAGLAPAIAKGGVGFTAENNMDAIYRQITHIRTTAFVEPSGIVIDPLGWQEIELSKSTQGVYLAGGPFLDTITPRLWGLKVVVTPRMPASEALVGAFDTCAAVFRKGGLRVDASNSHNDNFAKNLTTLRAEERVGLACYRPQAFGIVSALS